MGMVTVPNSVAIYLNAEEEMSVKFVFLQSRIAEVSETARFNTIMQQFQILWQATLIQKKRHQ